MAAPPAPPPAPALPSPRPPGPIASLLPPLPQPQPTDSDVVHAAEYASSVKRLRVSGPGLVTIEEMAGAIKNEYAIISQAVGAGAAPAWARPLFTGMANLTAQMTAMNTQINALTAKMTAMESRNMLRKANKANKGSLQPLPNDRNQLPAAFPASQRQLLGWDNTQLSALLTFYNLPTGGTVAEKRERLLAFLF
ncbi:Proline rich coiled-coil 2A [Balamuthia mandrillaris]